MNKKKQQSTDGMRVVELTIENYMGVRAVEIKPTGNVVRIEGKNGAGKSTVIDSIWVAIGGMDEAGKHPLRNGEKKGRVYVDLGDIRVERKFTESGSYLEVSDVEGKRMPRPQEFLDQFYTKTTIDPQNFIRLKASDRRNLLLDLAGKRKEIEDLDAQRQELYNERTITNREIKTLQGKLAGRKPEMEVGVEIPIAGLLKELEKAVSADRALDTLKSYVPGTRAEIDREQLLIKQREKEIQRLNDSIKLSTDKISELKSDLDETIEKINKAPKSTSASIRTQIAEAEKSNEVARKNAEYFELDAQLRNAEQESADFSNAIDEIDERKKDIITEASLSVGDIGFDGDVLLVNGTPFDDLSTSEQLKISLHIAMSQNPKLRVVRVSDGNVFDADSMNEIEVFAEEHNCQLWIERVQNSPDGSGFFIRDGEILQDKDIL